jgi:hypothetical protein
MAFSRPRLLPLFPLLLLACSSRESTQNGSTPLGTLATPATPALGATVDGAGVLARAGRFAPIKGALDRRAALESRPQGFVRKGTTVSTPLREATLPRVASAPVHLVPQKDETAWVDVRALETESALGALHENAVVYQDVAPSTDVIMTAEGARIEETRILRDANAKATFRYALQLGPGVAEARVRSGMVELADATGYVHLSTDVAYAVDARGTVRNLDVSIAGEGRARTVTATLDTAGLEYPIAVDPVWTTAPNQPGGPRSNVAITMSNNKVFVIGGYSPYTCLYNPATNTWEGGTIAGSTIPNVPLTHDDGSTNPISKLLQATKLNDGTILVVGGGTDTGYAIFNPATNTYAKAANTQITACQDCGLVTLSDGRVFKMNGTSFASAEIWSPTSKAWSAAAAPTMIPYGPALAFALKGGTAPRVLVFGGNPPQSAAMWTSNGTSGAGTWSALIVTRRMTGASGTALSDGRALIVGYPAGSGAPPMVGVLFDPASLSFKDTALNPLANLNIGVTLLPSGMVLAAGGQSTATTPIATSASAIYDPTADTWTSIDSLPAVQAGMAMAVMNNNSVLAVGGFQNYGSPTVQAAVYTPLAQGASCATPLRPQTCVTGYCVNNVCCTTSSCPNGVCNAPAVTGRAAGVCALNNGQACTKTADCASGNCVDGVCCNTACTGQCESCNGAGTAGTCTAVTGSPTGGRPACTGVGAGTSCGPTCNGTNRTACVYAPAGTVACGLAGCTGGVQTTASKCDGKGVCPNTSSSCGAYACGPSACLTTCANDSYCATGYYCDVPSSTCVPKIGLGTTCTTSSQCSAGTYCTDGVCCGVATCGAGSSCALGTAGGTIAPGTCSKVNGTACASNAECGSNHCVDGVCCDTACTDQCAACDVATKVGTCSPVLGKPHGTTRAACDDGGSNKCAAKQCDGTANTAACNGLVNDGTVQCAAAECKGTSVQPAAFCDGAGACVAPTLSSCGKYACDPTALACRTSCTTDTDCAGDSKCYSGKCTDARSCSTDGNASIDPVTKESKDCAPFKCGTSGDCLQKCATSDDCQAGLTCDLSTGQGQCLPASTGSKDSGGCATAPGEEGNARLAAIALGAVGLMIAGRKRARRS